MKKLGKQKRQKLKNHNRKLPRKKHLEKPPNQKALEVYFLEFL